MTVFLKYCSRRWLTYEQKEIYWWKLMAPGWWRCFIAFRISITFTWLWSFCLEVNKFCNLIISSPSHSVQQKLWLSEIWRENSYAIIIAEERGAWKALLLCDEAGLFESPLPAQSSVTWLGLSLCEQQMPLLTWWWSVVFTPLPTTSFGTAPLALMGLATPRDQCGSGGCCGLDFAPQEFCVHSTSLPGCKGFWSL